MFGTATFPRELWLPAVLTTTNNLAAPTFLLALTGDEWKPMTLDADLENFPRGVAKVRTAGVAIYPVATEAGKTFDWQCIAYEPVIEQRGTGSAASLKTRMAAATTYWRATQLWRASVTVGTLLAGQNGKADAGYYWARDIQYITGHGFPTGLADFTKISPIRYSPNDDASEAFIAIEDFSHRFAFIRHIVKLTTTGGAWTGGKGANFFMQAIN